MRRGKAIVAHSTAGVQSPDLEACYNGQGSKKKVRATMSSKTIRATRHRSQVIRQIWLPFGGGMVLIAGLAALAGWAGLGTAGLWADIALVWLTALAMIAGVIVLAVVVGAVVASEWVMRWIPPQAARLHHLVAPIPAGVGRGADALVRPVIVVRSVGSALAHLFGRRR